MNAASMILSQPGKSIFLPFLEHLLEHLTVSLENVTFLLKHIGLHLLSSS